MAAPLKTRGIQEAKVLQKRVNRQFALGRIDKERRDYLDKRLDEIIWCIEDMKEETNGEQTNSDHQTV